MVKPPLGVKPKIIHDYHRAIDLSEAIWEYINYYYSNGKYNYELLDKWIQELNSLNFLLSEQCGRSEKGRTK